MGLLGLLAIALIAPWSHAQESAGTTAATIESIEVAGVQRIEPTTVKAYLSVEVGDSFAAIEPDSVLQDLYDTGLFRDIELIRRDATLIVKVTENAIINRVVFEGNDAIDNETLKQEIRLRARDVFTPSAVGQDVQTLRRVYRRRGRFNAAIEPEIIERDQNRVDLIFNIQEGPATKVRGIHFIGNQAFSDGELREQMRTSEARWWRLFQRGDGYDPDRLAADEQLLKRFYGNRGYADATIVSRVAELAPNNEDFFVTFSVEEGPRYRFGDVAVESSIEEVDSATLQGEATIDSGDWFSNKALQNSMDAINAELESQRFVFVDIRPRLERNREAKTIDVVFEVGEGQRAVIERIDITGNDRTADRVIRRELQLAEGDPFNRQRLRQSERALRNLGYFSSINIDVREGAGPGQLVIEVAVTEKSTGELSFGAGFTTGTGPVLQASVSERNLAGRGQKIDLRTELSFQRTSLEFSFTEPYFRGRDMDGGVSLFRRTEDRQRARGFSQSEVGGELSLDYPLSRDIRQRASYRLESKKVSADNDASPILQAQEGRTVTSSVAHRTTLDKRDNRFNPSQGYLLELTNRLAGLGGDRRHLETVASYERYFSLGDTGMVLEFSGESGYIFGLNQSLRINERFFLGGNKVRGFENSGIGPRDTSSGDPLGGRLYSAGTSQLFVPTPMPQDQIRLHFFADAGTLHDVAASGPAVEDRGSLRTSLGFGLTWRSPAGPITMNWGWPIKRESYDREQRFRFNFGIRN